MRDDNIQQLTMPKWGLSMAQGKVVEWLIPEGTRIEPGTEVIEVESEKITGSVEASVAGVLRRCVATPGQEIPVGGLLGVVASEEVPDEDIDQYVENYVPIEVDEGDTAKEPETECLDVDGRTIRYLKRGEAGTPVLLIHGFGGNLDNWLFNHEPLATERAVYALDLPGHGNSSKDVGPGDLDALVEFTLGWIEAIALPEVHLVGHSLGGAIALALALRVPRRVRSCTLIASAGLGPEIDAAYIEGFVGSERRKQLKPHLEKLFANSSLITRQLVDDVLKFKRLDGVRESLQRIADNVFSDGTQAVVMRDELKSLTVPVLVLWGAEDKIVPASHAEGLPDSVRVEVLDNCGHMVQMEAAGDVNRLISQHLGNAEQHLGNPEQ